MKKTLTYITVFTLLTSCSNYKKLNISEIETIYFEYNSQAPLNYGSTIEGRILARVEDGKEHDITNNKNLTFSSADLAQVGNSRAFQIVRKPREFNENIAVWTFTYAVKDESISVSDTMIINHRAPIVMLANGVDGEDGEDQRNKSTPLVFRDGNNGENGGPGLSGTHAPDLVVRIWKDNGVVYAHSTETITSQVWKYQSTDAASLSFELTGGDGGNGGNGGDGGDGKDGKEGKNSNKRPGDGGNGGDGGSGGNGGNGGNLTIILHPSAADLEPAIRYDLSAGRRGTAGEPGKAGSPGTPLEGQTAGSAGLPGSNGFTGVDGSEGNFQLSVQSFDFTTL